MTTHLRITVFSILYLFYGFSTIAQTSFINLDSLNNLKSPIFNDKIVIGELHGVAKTYEAYEKIILSLDVNKPYKLVIERGLSFSYLINEYLTNADTTVIDKIIFENEAEKKLYKSIQSLNNSVRSKNKITAIGIDLEYQKEFIQTLVALEYYLPKTHFQVSQQQLAVIGSDNGKSTQDKIRDMLNLIDTSKFEHQQYDILIKNIVSNYKETINISSSSNLTWGRKREKLLLINFNNRVTGIENFCFIIGVAHLPDNALYPAFTKHINKQISKDFRYFYPIYFNHASHPFLENRYYCEHRHDPLKSNKNLFHYFDTHKSAWILKDSNLNYIVISN